MAAVDPFAEPHFGQTFNSADVTVGALAVGVDGGCCSDCLFQNHPLVLLNRG